MKDNEMRFLKFDSEAQALDAFAQWATDEAAFPSYIGSVAVDVIGVVHQPTGNALDTPDGPVPETTSLTGWHINLSDQVQELQAYEIDQPSRPARVFAGAWPESEPAVPQRVTMRQARLALLGAGLIGDVDAAINAMPSPQKEAARIEWEYGQEVQRHNGFVSVLAPSLGLTDAQTDALFIAAAGL